MPSYFGSKLRDQESSLDILTTQVDAYLKYLENIEETSSAKSPSLKENIFKIKKQKLQALYDQLQQKNQFNTRLYTQIQDVLTYCAKNQPDKNERSFLLAIWDTLASLLNVSLEGQSKWKNFMDAAKKASATAIPLYLFDKNSGQLDNNLTNEEQNSNTSEMLKNLLKGFDQEGYFPKGTELVTIKNQHFKLDCDVIILGRGDKKELYPIITKLGSGKYGEVYQALPKHIMFENGRLHIKQTSLQAFKLIDYRNLIRKINVVGTVMNTKLGMIIASWLAKGVEQGDINNEIQKGNKYLQIDKNSKDTLMHGVDVLVDYCPVTIIQQILLEGKSLNQYLGYGNPDYHSLTTIDQIIDAADQPNELPMEERYTLAANLTEQVAKLSAEGLIHGDLFLDNIQVLKNSQDIKLMDFSFSRHIDELKKKKMHHSWQAFTPHKFEDEKDPLATQVFALGANLQLIFSLKNAQVQDPYSVDEHLRAIAALIKQMKDPLPNQRIPMHEVKKQLETIIRENAVNIRSTSSSPNEKFSL